MRELRYAHTEFEIDHFRRDSRGVTFTEASMYRLVGAHVRF